MAGFSVFAVTFTGVDLTVTPGPATISVPGVKAGDRRVHLAQDADPTNDAYNSLGLFASVITTDDEIVQNKGNATVSYTAVFVRFS